MISVDYEQVVYNGNGSQTAWPYSFPIYDGDVVRLILLDADGTETDITQDYFVDVPGSTVYYPGYAPGEEPPVADQPPKLQSGQKLIVYRDTEITQDSDLGDKWPFDVIEKGLDKLTMILQEKAFALARCLKISQGQAAEIDDYDPTVPLAAGKVICGNADGDGFEAREAMMEVNGDWDGEGRQIHSVADPTADQDAATKNYVDTLTDNNFMKLQPDGEAWEARNLPIHNVGGPVNVHDTATKDYVDGLLNGFVLAGDSRTVPFDTVAQMRSSDLAAGQIAGTLGYSDINDGGAGVYNIRAAVPGDTDDGGSIIVLDNGKVAELITDGIVDIKQFGAVGDGSADDSVPLQKALNCGKKIHIGCSIVASNVSIPSNSYIFGNGKIIQKDTGDTTPALTATNVSNIVIEGVGLESQSLSYNTRENGAFVFSGCSDVTIKENHVASNADRNIVALSCDDFTVNGVVSDGVGSLVTLFNCDNSTVSDIEINGDENSLYHGIDFYADYGYVCNNCFAHNITLVNVGSSGLQITANQSADSDFTNSHFYNINAVSSGVPVKFDGCSVVLFDRVYAENCKYGGSSAGISTSDTVDVVVKDCTFINILSTNYVIVSSKIANCFYINNNFIDCASICSNDVKSLVLKGNNIYARTAMGCVMSKSNAEPETVVMMNNTISGAFTSFTMPSNAKKVIIKNNVYDCPSFSSNVVRVFYASEELCLTGNSFTVGSMMDTFRIQKPSWYTGSDSDVTKVCHYGNDVNGTLMTINGSDNTTYSESTYTLNA